MYGNVFTMIAGVGNVNFIFGWVDSDRLVLLLGQQKHLLYDPSPPRY
jgi:hypothetical protein